MFGKVGINFLNILNSDTCFVPWCFFPLHLAIITEEFPLGLKRDY
jgi:hypothetical protein